MHKETEDSKSIVLNYSNNLPAITSRRISMNHDFNMEILNGGAPDESKYPQLQHRQ